MTRIDATAVLEPSMVVLTAYGEGIVRTVHLGNTCAVEIGGKLVTCYQGAVSRITRLKPETMRAALRVVA